jgi:TonB family protein
MKTIITTILTVILTINLFAQQTINETVFFDYNKYDLTANAMNILDKCYDKIKDSDFRQITIIGHTDADGSDSYNMTLSENRTKTVLNYFLSKGISMDKIKIQFFGEKKPISKNDNDLDKQQNRRVEIVIEQGNSDSELQFNKHSQFFLISTDKDTILNCAEGTIIKIKANSFVSEKTGKPIAGIVKFSVTEFYKISDILLSNLSTTSNGQLLETGGMVNITATSNNENLKLKKGQSIEIQFPTKQKENDMQLFSGEWENENHINWIPQTSAQQQVFVVVEEMPKFSGDENDISRFLSSTIKYPPQARELGLQGIVYVSFVINEIGEVTEPRIARGVAPDLDEAALNAIRKMPNWTPGKQRGQNVSVQMTLPVKFDLGDNSYGDTSLVWEGSFKERFEKSFADTTIEKASSGNIMYYVFNSTQLGWINCDRFIKVSPKTNYIVKLDKDIDNVKIVFDRYKSVMDVFPKNGVYTFNNVPVGEKITIVAIKRVDNKPYLAVKQTKTSSQVEKDLLFQPVTMEMLQTEMKKLDRFN